MRALTASLLAALGAGACDQRNLVTVFHAASLSGVLSEVQADFRARSPGLELALEPSGSSVAARKVSELGRPADLVLVADWRVLDELLLPAYADFVLQFAANELVLAHGEHSRYTEEVTASNWPEILARPDVRLGRADPATAPLGYQTLLVLELAAQGGAPPQPDLTARLAARCRPEHVVPDVTELAALLEARAIDYAFLYRSTAEEHRLKVVRLPPAQNLGDPDRAAEYARARVQVALRPGAPTALRGEPILFGLTVPRQAPHPDRGLAVAAALLGPDGRRLLGRFGFTPVARSPRPERLPEALAGFLP